MKKITTFEEDKLNLKPFCDSLEKYLMVEHDYVNESLVVSIEAGFGHGKSTLISMWKDDIEKRGHANPTLPTPIILNAWESDYCGDPLLALISKLISIVESQKSPKESKLRKSAENLFLITSAITNQLGGKLIEKATGINVGRVKEDVAKKKISQSLKLNCISLYEDKVQALSKLKEALSEEFGGEKPKAIIFIDELDRCRPDYAISYLETIKHVFDIHGLVFVLAIDRKQLESSAKALFGSLLNFDEYLRKFIHRSFSLPELSKHDLSKISSDYISVYLEIEGKRLSIINNKTFRDNIVDLLIGLKIKPRQLQEIFRTIGHTAETTDPKFRGGMYWCLSMALVFMSVLKVTKKNFYDSLNRDTLEYRDHEAVLDFFIIAVKKRSVIRWWFAIYATGVGADLSTFNTILKQKLHDIEVMSDDHYKQTLRGWGDWGCGDKEERAENLKKICDVIETAKTFLEI